ncbi:MAG: penicillin-binding transpeptidase domain-containing protein [Clostridium sp.]|nr:penicillin-binding transpeptidase domain-containing protein [Clostridium sp.]
MEKRLLHILCFFITIIVLLAIRVAVLQLYPSENVQSSYQNHQHENITNMKYSILDTNENDLLKYKKKYVLVIDAKPFSLNNYEETLQDLMAMNFIMKGENPDFNYSDVMKQSGKLYYTISEDTYEKIKNLKNIKGIYEYEAQEADIKYAWSVGSLFSEIMDNEHEADSLESDLYEYLKNNETPKEEFYLDEKAVYSKEEFNTNEDNRNLQLTVDEKLTDKVKEILDGDDYSSLKNIGVVLLESDTGKIRVLTQKDESQANINLAMQQIGYEPGSIYKIITLSSALEEGLISVNEKYNCKGQICKVPHGVITIESAFEKSCNDVFAQIGSKVGYNKLMEYSEKLGLYSRVLGLKDSDQNESSGLKPEEEAGLNNISIGQCMNVTPLQMAGAINAVVNNGIYVKPYIVEAILDKDNNVVKSMETDKGRVYSETTAKIVKNSMRNVVLRGTGTKADIKGMNIGGKTGSATGSQNKTHGWFAGYFTYKNKNYTMVIFTPELEGIGENNEEAGGGNTAAPIFKEIVNKITK